MRRLGISLTLWLLAMSSVSASKLPGESGAYAREVGFEQRFFYVAAGDGVGQIEYICRAYAGLPENDNTAAAVWQVQRFTYDSSDRLSTIAFAGDEDNYNQVCDNRTSLDYS